MRRRTLMLGGAFALIAPRAYASTELTDDDMVIGSATAPVTMIEYASVTCPTCAAFHAALWEPLREIYVDTGRVRIAFREFPTPPEAVALAGFQIARARNATPDQYIARVGELFRQQQSIFSETTMQGVLRRLIAIGEGFGLTAAEVNAAINDRSGAERIRRIVEGAAVFDIHSTPSFIINGARYEGPLSGRDLANALDAAGSQASP